MAVAQHPSAALPRPRQLLVFQAVPVGVDRTLETWDFYFETADLEDTEAQSVRYIDEVLQRQGHRAGGERPARHAPPAFDQGRIVCDPSGSGLSEHGVHHFHGLVLDGYRSWVEGLGTKTDHGDAVSTLTI
ncbi:hypothetical protein [Nonomuraea sp. NPDC049028]|uniref:hypothetical protein n=1 Tax=Nonomuraea sp. NPDC049028 TaxID=3364348 RepID=UPI00371DA8F8